MIQKNEPLLQIISGLAAQPGSGDAIPVRMYERGQQLIRQDQENTGVFIIRSGVVKCYITEENGKEYVLEFLGEGEILGELEALRKISALTTVEALTPVEAWRMNASDLLYYLQTRPDLNMAVLELLAGRLAATAVRSSRQQLHTLSHSLAQLVGALESQQIVFTKQDLAAYLGISIRSLNRLLQTRNGSKEELTG